ncbi:MAG: hypothetical protein NUW37_05910 [Planctomycetes bacterium]|nr:hypothetical protein [Planctomycetota bacterium]
MPDLWKDTFEISKMKTPVSILKEQAEYLSQKTAGVVYAEVDDLSESAFDFTTGSNIDFHFSFNIRGRDLNYTFRVMRVWHGINLYPASITPDTDIANELKKLGVMLNEYNSLSVKDEKEMEQRLGEILKTDKVARVVGGILSISK